MALACGYTALVHECFSRRLFLYLAYLDDSGTKYRGNAFQVVCAVVIEDEVFRNLELVMGASACFHLPAI
jgi:hypothetical protein